MLLVKKKNRISGCVMKRTEITLMKYGIIYKSITYSNCIY